MKLPELPSFEPKPKTWDFIALATVVVGAALVGLNIAASHPDEAGSSIGGLPTFLFVLGHMAVCLGSLMVLGKTAKEGTIWGNLAALAGSFAGLSGVMVAAALWAAA